MRVVDPVAESVVPEQSVIVFEGKIAWVGDVAKEPKVADATIVDGQDHYLAPGLTDMHVHVGPADG